MTPKTTGHGYTRFQILLSGFLISGCMMSIEEGNDGLGVGDNKSEGATSGASDEEDDADDSASPDEDDSNSSDDDDASDDDSSSSQDDDEEDEDDASSEDDESETTDEDDDESTESDDEDDDPTSSDPDDSTSDEDDDSSSEVPESVSGPLEIAFTTVAYGGRYSPRNIGAVWIEDADGKFLRTVQLRARIRMRHLIAWSSETSSNSTDAVTSATANQHMRHEVQWDRMDAQGNEHGVGDYVLRIEMTEDHSTVGNKEGPNFSVPFHLGGGSKSIDVPDQKGFSDIEITTPD